VGDVLVRDVVSLGGTASAATSPAVRSRDRGLSAGAFGAVGHRPAESRNVRHRRVVVGYFQPFRDGPRRMRARSLEAHDPTLLVRGEAALLRAGTSASFWTTGLTTRIFRPLEYDSRGATRTEAHVSARASQAPDGGKYLRL